MTLVDLQHCIANREAEGIEFKPALLSRREIAEYAVGIGNAGGGHLIMGVTNKPPRQIQPVSPPSEEEIQQIRRSVYDSAQIHIRVENLATPSGNVVIVPIPARPRGDVFHTRDGKYLIRVGEDLRGLTLTEIDAMRREAGVEFTAAPIPGLPADLLSPAGFEQLRELMFEAHSPSDFAAMKDADLLAALGLLTASGQFNVAGLLLLGRTDAIRQYVPHAQWQFRRMLSDTDYDQTDDGCDCIAVGLRKLRDYIRANNPITTVPGWLVHPEFPRYPVLAMREILLNALIHRDYTQPGAVALKIYPRKLELSNPGGFIGGVTPENILHHPSSPRYPTLFQAFVRLRLANAANLGVPRAFRELLSEGKEPPQYWASSQTVRVTVLGQEARREFLELVQKNPGLGVDHLLLLHHLTRHREITATEAAILCHRPLAEARETLSELMSQWRLVEAGGPSGRGRYYRLTSPAYDLLGQSLAYYVDSRLSRENAKGRVLTALNKGSLNNAQIREITQLGRVQAWRLMKQLQAEGLVNKTSDKRYARWCLRHPETVAPPAQET
ncbi:MAG: putative DNA binding domain-containing protein [Verrucomicrobia bacterium]|nr:putative DNA binding domain-containing protein [Verrucomicrobiota bacterium]